MYSVVLNNCMPLPYRDALCLFSWASFMKHLINVQFLYIVNTTASLYICLS